MDINDNILRGMTVTPIGLPLMRDAWLGCLHWAIGNEDMRRRFTKETGIDLNSLVGRSRIEALIDETTGRQHDIIVKFCDWATESVWGAVRDK